MAYPPNNGVPLEDDVVPGDGTGDVIYAAHINDIVTELGGNPSGTYATVGDRVAELEVSTLVSSGQYLAFREPTEVIALVDFRIADDGGAIAVVGDFVGHSDDLNGPVTVDVYDRVDLADLAGSVPEDYQPALVENGHFVLDEMVAPDSAALFLDLTPLSDDPDVDTLGGLTTAISFAAGDSIEAVSILALAYVNGDTGDYVAFVITSYDDPVDGWGQYVERFTNDITISETPGVGAQRIAHADNNSITVAFDQPDWVVTTSGGDRLVFTHESAVIPSNEIASMGMRSIQIHVAGAINWIGVANPEAISAVNPKELAMHFDAAGLYRDARYGSSYSGEGSETEVLYSWDAQPRLISLSPNNSIRNIDVGSDFLVEQYVFDCKPGTTVVLADDDAGSWLGILPCNRDWLPGQVITLVRDPASTEDVTVVVKYGRMLNRSVFDEMSSVPLLDSGNPFMSFMADNQNGSWFPI